MFNRKKTKKVKRLFGEVKYTSSTKLYELKVFTEYLFIDLFIGLQAEKPKFMRLRKYDHNTILYRILPI